MKTWKSILLLLLVFCAGLSVGIVGTRAAYRQAVQTAIAHPEKTQLFIEHNLDRRLRLDNDQQIKLHAILTEARSQLTGLRQQFQPQATAVLHDTDQKISALLTPAQQARYDRFKEQNWPALRRLRTADQ
jgi:hypothetical protein